MAAFPIQLTTNPHQIREPRGPSPSGGKTPANLLSLEDPRALWGAVWGAVWGAGRREEACILWMQPPQAVSDRQPSTETRIWHGSAKDDD